MHNPLVSVIMPAHNSERTLVRSVGSVLQQDMRDLEVLAVDDGSTDDTYGVLMELQRDDFRVRPIRRSVNGGAAVARNEALDQARGRYIAFLDSDDMWDRSKLVRQLEFMQETHAPISYTSYYRRYDHDDSLQSIVRARPYCDYRLLMRTNAIGMSTAIVDRDLVGAFRLSDLRKRQDYALWISLAEAGHVARGMKSILATYYIRSDSLSSNTIASLRSTWRIYRDVARLSPSKAFLSMVANVTIAARKRI